MQLVYLFYFYQSTFIKTGDFISLSSIVFSFSNFFPSHNKIPNFKSLKLIYVFFNNSITSKILTFLSINKTYLLQSVV